MISFNVDDVMDLKPCLSKNKVEKLFKMHGFEGQAVPLAEIVRCYDIQIDYRIWLAVQKGDHVKRFLEMTCERVIYKYALNDPVLKEWAKAWLKGENRNIEYYLSSPFYGTTIKGCDHIRESVYRAAQAAAYSDYYTQRIDTKAAAYIWYYNTKEASRHAYDALHLADTAAYQAGCVLERAFQLIDLYSLLPLEKNND